jgi:hypothetical protein
VFYFYHTPLPYKPPTRKKFRFSQKLGNLKISKSQNLKKKVKLIFMSMPLIFGDFAPAELTELTLDRTAMQANPPPLLKNF